MRLSVHGEGGRYHQMHQKIGTCRVPHPDIRPTSILLKCCLVHFQWGHLKCFAEYNSLPCVEGKSMEKATGRTWIFLCCQWNTWFGWRLPWVSNPWWIQSLVYSVANAKDTKLSLFQNRLLSTYFSRTLMTISRTYFDDFKMRDKFWSVLGK